MEDNDGLVVALSSEDENRLWAGKSHGETLCLYLGATPIII